MAATKANPAVKGNGKAPRGRPSKYTPELVKAIFARMAAGEALANICRDEKMPAYRTVKDWIDDPAKELTAAYVRAREDWIDSIALDALRIADTPMPGVTEKQELLGINKSGKGDDGIESADWSGAEMVTTEIKTEDMLGHRKLQIDTRLRLIKCWDPKRYGEKVAVEHDVSDDMAEAMKAARERATNR